MHQIEAAGAQGAPEALPHPPLEDVVEQALVCGDERPGVVVALAQPAHQAPERTGEGRVFDDSEVAALDKARARRCWTDCAHSSRGARRPDGRAPASGTSPREARWSNPGWRPRRAAARADARLAPAWFRTRCSSCLTMALVAHYASRPVCPASPARTFPQTSGAHPPGPFRTRESRRSGAKKETGEHPSCERRDPDLEPVRAAGTACIAAAFSVRLLTTRSWWSTTDPSRPRRFPHRQRPVHRSVSSGRRMQGPRALVTVGSSKRAGMSSFCSTTT